MPQGREHCDFCRRWEIKRCLYDIKCPIDMGAWHSRHNVNQIVDYSEVEKPPEIDGSVNWPKIDTCIAWVQRALDKMEPHFYDFYLQFKDVSREEARACWTAHLVVDYACAYCYVATYQKGKYREIKKNDPAYWSLFCDYVTEIYKSILATSPKLHS
jgi:hypothetical protein